MTKRLTMAAVDTILTLHKAGHSNREIAALLGVNRETVGKYLARVRAGYQPNAPTGNSTNDPNNAPAGSDAGDGHAAAASENQPNAPTGSTSPPTNGPPSECEPFREEILAKIEQGLEAVRIHQDLAEDHRDSAPSYYSVRRFIARLRHKTPLPFRRMETEPGEEAQVDFGTGAAVRTADGKVLLPFRRQPVDPDRAIRHMEVLLVLLLLLPHSPPKKKDGSFLFPGGEQEEPSSSYGLLVLLLSATPNVAFPGREFQGKRGAEPRTSPRTSPGIPTRASPAPLM